MQENLGTFLSSLSENEKRVFDIVWKHTPIERKEIAKLTGLTSMSVTRITRNLQEYNLVFDDVDRSGKRGQPARPLSINVDGAYSFGVSFSYQSIEVALVNLHGQTLSVDTQTLKEPQPELIAKSTRESIQRLLKLSKVPADKVIGVGFAMPGDFGSSPLTMAIESQGFTQLNDLDLTTEFERIIGQRCFIENDSTSAALGERVLGAGQNYETFLFVLIGHGIGAGLFLNGSIYRGVNGNAGIIGIHFPNSEPRPSGQNLLEVLHKNESDINDFSDLESVMPTDHSIVNQWVRRAGKQLREKLSYPARLIDPSAVIIGGRLPVQINQALATQIDTKDFCSNSPRAPKPKILASTLGTKGVVIGAAIVPIYQTLFSTSEDRLEDHTGSI